VQAAKYAKDDEAVDAGLFDGLRFVHGGVQSRSNSYLEYATRLAALEAAMKKSGTWWAAHASTAREIIAAALDEIDPRELQDGHVMTYPLLPRACATPFFPAPTQARCFLFDILPNIDVDDTRRLATFEARSERILRRAREGGARVYPIGYPVGTDQMSRSDWQRQLGTAWRSFAAAKAAYDPGGLLTPGPMVF
jgi:FAD/FMN-containing dehydrogenase